MSSDASSNDYDSDSDAAAVLEFWFGDLDEPENAKQRRDLWFASTPDQDSEIRQRFGVLHEKAQAGDLAHWAEAPRTALALIVLLDQFTRNLYRGDGAAFANDARSLALASAAVERGFDRTLHPVERAFLYMPFQHSENPDDQDLSMRLYRGLLDECPPSLKAFARDTYDHAALHRDIIERFGRFPHRNELLGRSSTESERRYLEEGGHRFGQG